MIAAVFETSERLTLWWGNPNHTAAGLAMLVTGALALLGGRKNRPVRFLTWSLVAVTGWCLLCLTQSRGALVAVVAGELAAILIFRPTLALKRYLALVCVFLAVFALSGLSRRTTQVLSMSDGSTLARMRLWRHSTAMIAYRPLAGWGEGNSGRDYMNFFQPLDDRRAYGGPGNSYLHIAVEHGLPMLAVALLPFACGWLAAARLARTALSDTHRTAVLISFKVITIWLVCAFFSTLWQLPSLIVPAVAALGVVGWVHWQSQPRQERWAVLRDAGFTVAGCGTALAMAALIARHTGSYQCSLSRPDMVVLQTGAPGAGLVIGVHSDPKVLGPQAGRLLRSALTRLSVPLTVVLARNASLPAAGSFPVDCEVAFGRSYANVVPGVKSLVLVRPIYTGTEPSSPPTMVMMPSFDDFGDRKYWDDYCERHGLPVTVLGSPIFTITQVAEILGGLSVERPRAVTTQ